MRVPFTKMQGAGNDFVVLGATAAPLTLVLAHVKGAQKAKAARA